MKKYSLLVILLVLNTSHCLSAEKEKIKKDKKIYTQKEFSDELEKEVIRKLAKVTGESLKDFAQSLLDKEKSLGVMEEDIKKRQQELVLIEKNLQGKLKEFRGQQDNIIGCMNENEKESSKRIDHIVKVISGMKPANAAEILAVQDSVISVQIISKLNPEKVSKIFNLMDKEISARLQKSYINMKR
jgi:flagellar motility protein MotE (MotC chaperone)